MRTQSCDVLGIVRQPGGLREWPLLSVQGKKKQASKEQQNKCLRMQNCYQMSSLDAHAMSAEEESMLVWGVRPTFLSIPPSPLKLCALLPHMAYENNPLPSFFCRLSHLGGKLDSFNTRFSSKGPGSFRGWCRGCGKGSVGENLPSVEPIRVGKFSSYSPLLAWNTVGWDGPDGWRPKLSCFSKWLSVPSPTYFCKLLY